MNSSKRDAVELGVRRIVFCEDRKTGLIVKPIVWVNLLHKEGKNRVNLLHKEQKISTPRGASV